MLPPTDLGPTTNRARSSSRPPVQGAAYRALQVLLATLLLVLGGETTSFGAPPELGGHVSRVPALRAPRTRVGTQAAIAPVTPAAPARRWDTHPAMVEHRPKGTVYAVSDIHGRYDSAFKLLSGNRLMKGDPARPKDVVWTGGKSTLVVVGDSINKGNGSVHTIDMLRSLQASAEKRGGKVIVLFGNHEASFIHEPLSARSMRDGSEAARGHIGFGHDLQRRGISPQEVAHGTDAEGRGAWLRSLPFGAVVGNTFFSHSGSTNGMTRQDFERHVRAEVSRNGYGHENVVGSDATVLGADSWKDTAARARQNAGKLAVKRIVMGHIPDALEASGGIARTKNGRLVKIDTGLGNEQGDARLLRISRSGRSLRQLDAQGESSKVPRYKGR